MHNDGEIEPSKQFKWSVCRWKRHIVYISKLSVQLEAQDVNISANLSHL